MQWVRVDVRTKACMVSKECHWDLLLTKHVGRVAAQNKSQDCKWRSLEVLEHQRDGREGHGPIT